MKVHKPPKLSSRKASMIFYGVTDSGKTHLLMTAQDCPVTTPVLFINIDQGDLTLAPRPDIDVVDVHNFDELQEVYDELAGSNHKYKSVAIDSLTAQQRDISMPTVLKEIDKNRKFKELSRSKPPHRQDWLSSQHHMRTFILAFRDLAKTAKRKTHVFFSANERIDDRRDLGVPALPGVLATECGGYVDVMARLVLEARGKKEVRRLYTLKHEDPDDGMIYLCKNRLRLLPRVIKNPSISDIMEYWTKGKETE